MGIRNMSNDKLIKEYKKLIKNSTSIEMCLLDMTFGKDLDDYIDNQEFLELSEKQIKLVLRVQFLAKELCRRKMFKEAIMAKNETIMAAMG